MKTAILVVAEQLSFGIGELTNRYVKNVQKHIKFQRLKNAIQNTNLKQKSSMSVCLKMAHNTPIGESLMNELFKAARELRQEKRERLLSEIMQGDEELGLYEVPTPKTKEPAQDTKNP